MKSKIFTSKPHSYGLIISIFIILILLGYGFSFQERLKTVSHGQILTYQVLGEGITTTGFSTLPDMMVFGESEEIQTYQSLFPSPGEPLYGLKVSPTTFNNNFIILLFAPIADSHNDIDIGISPSNKMEIHYEPAPVVEGKITIETIHSHYVILQVEKPKGAPNFKIELLDGTTVYKGQWVYIP